MGSIPKCGQRRRKNGKGSRCAAPGTALEEEELRLEQAAACHREAAEEMKREFFRAGEPVINGSALFDQMDFDPLAGAHAPLQ